MSQQIKTFNLSAANFNNLLKTLGKPIYSESNSNIYCFWRFELSRINVYKNSKNNAYKIVIQGEDIKNYVSMLENVSFEFKSNPQNKQYDFHCGADEAGKGEDFGPLVICFVVLNKAQQAYFKEMNIRDSKNFDDLQIIKLASFLIKNLKPEQYLLMTIPCDFINRQRKMNKNLHDIMIESYLNGTKEIIKRNKERNLQIVIDGFVAQETFTKKIPPKILKNYSILLEQKAEDKYLSVACASILARYQYIKVIEDLRYNFYYQFPIGANFQKNILPFIHFLAKKNYDKSKIIDMIELLTKNNLQKSLDEIDLVFANRE